MQLLQLGSYANCNIRSHEDDQKPDFWYLIMVDKVVQYPGTYVNFHGQISAQFLLDPTLTALSVQSLFTIDDKSGDITSHFIGHGKLHLPGIANSVGIKYGIVDIEQSVAQYLKTSLPTSNVAKAIDYVKVTIQEAMSPQCNCGARKLGYKDDELHGHARWCKLVTDSVKYVGHGNGD